ncbi:MAG TPA: serine hydrolase domain-containing protein [Ktedonobacterales bacterium]|jgi:CubicO group peptidase (beta-lactamase class C family)
MRDLVDTCVEPALRTYPRSVLVIGIICRGQQHVFGYGPVGAEWHGAPVGDTLFEIGSVTKVFTSALLATCVQKGLVRLDDPASSYLPPQAHLPDEVTLLALATHTSGLPRLPGNIWRSWLRHPRNPYAAYTEPLLYAALNAYKPRRPAAGTFQYSNLGGGLLGYLLARAHALPYADALQREVCGPLGLTETWIHVPPEHSQQLAPPRSARGRLTSGWDAPVLAGAGALRSTARDLLRFLDANLGDAPPDLAEPLEICQTIRAEAPAPMCGVGLGWMVSRWSADDDTTLLHWHDGATGGYSSFLGMVRSQGVGVVVLTNHGPDSYRRRNWPRSPGALGIELLRALCR